jgi:hypothetical protein
VEHIVAGTQLPRPPTQLGTRFAGEGGTHPQRSWVPATREEVGVGGGYDFGKLVPTRERTPRILHAKPPPKADTGEAWVGRVGRGIREAPSPPEGGNARRAEKLGTGKAWVGSASEKGGPAPPPTKLGSRYAAMGTIGRKWGLGRRLFFCARV